MTGAEPNPSPAPQIADVREAGRARRLWCKRYDWCLSTATRLKWRGFTCAECSVDEPEAALVRLRRVALTGGDRAPEHEGPDGATLDEVGAAVGRTRQAVQKYVVAVFKRLREVAEAAGLGAG